MPSDGFQTNPPPHLYDPEPAPSIEASPVDAGAADRWGLAACLLGLGVDIAVGMVLVHNMIFLTVGPGRIDHAAGAGFATFTLFLIASMALTGSVFGLRGCWLAFARRSTPALPLAGVFLCGAGLLLWLV